jgi:hypothetical protein
VLALRRLSALTIVASLAALGACSSDSAKPQPTPATTQSSEPPSKTRSAAAPKMHVDVKDAKFVINDDASATLVATISNRTGRPIRLNDAQFGPESIDARPLSFHGDRAIKKGETLTVGSANAPIRIRLPRNSYGKGPVRMMLQFTSDGSEMTHWFEPKFSAPVTRRTSADRLIFGNTGNDLISAVEGKVHVLPGQDEAFIDVAFDARIQDVAYDLPTATRADGTPIKVRFQTVTGGPYGISVGPDEPSEIGHPPFTSPKRRDFGLSEHFLASEVRVGETITLRTDFQSGYVLTKLTVVAG